VDSEKLARALADRFQRIVPEGYYVYEDQGMIWYHGRPSPDGYGGSRSGSYIAENLHYGDTLEERVAWCAEKALGELQDHVDETSTEPWPGQRTVPRAHAAAIEGKLHLWFGDADAPVLECEPIGLASLD
jgi:hypothetical protein